MRIVVNGKLSAFSKWRGRFVGRLSELSRLSVEVLDGDRSYIFECGSRRELRRSSEALLKEPGTNAWIRNKVRPGEVFYDIGANIGVYTLMAGKQVGRTGRVYAFEPHAANFAQLLRNVKRNDLQGIVLPCCIALHNKSELVNFNYMDLGVARGHSQVNQLTDYMGEQFEAELAEPKVSFSLDDLISQHGLLAPDHIKIDVDGNEIPILNGMLGVLTGEKSPKTIQVETNKTQNQELVPFMEKIGYRPLDRHFTTQGMRRIAAGGDPEDYPYNVIFGK
ncbi:MAG TPA: FkbM family methyltransferase [Terriglobia bacterium]|nr:FkbM family methyltransferase [Terriglobia bacterium]